MTPALFLDRDGTVNVSPGPGYVLEWGQFHFAPGVRELIQAAKERGFLVILVTSQQGVGKGLMSQADLDDIHARMQAELGPLAFDDIHACTHLDGTCTCRKPSPEMILTAASRNGIDLARSWNVGDKPRDVEMGRAAGVGTNLLIETADCPDLHAVRERFLAGNEDFKQRQERHRANLAALGPAVGMDDREIERTHRIIAGEE